jgi:CelD/BcsL family acetyltransferase involved in cellulose biosynthesis
LVNWLRTAVDARESILSDPRTDPRWRLLTEGKHGNLFTSPPWIDAVCGTYRFEPRCRILLDGGMPVAGLAWVPISDLRGDRLVSLPFSDRADPPVDDAATWAELRAAVVGPRAPFTVRCFDTAVPAFDPALAHVGTAAWHATALDAEPDVIYQRLSKHARRNIAIADRNEVRIETSATLAAVRSFHQLHVRLRKRKYQLLAQPVELFERIWQAFSADDAVVTLLAYAGEELIAGAVFLVWGDALYYKFGASRHEHLGLRPNDALFWAGIRWGVQRDLRWVDWGLSDLDQPGLVSYKRKWATDERSIVTLRGGGQDAREPDGAGAVLGELTRLLTDEAVPDHITEQAGALLYRYFC